MLDIVLYYTYRKYCLRPEFFTDIFSLVFMMWYYKSILFLSCVIGFAFFFDIPVVEFVSVVLCLHVSVSWWHWQFLHIARWLVAVNCLLAKADWFSALISVSWYCKCYRYCKYDKSSSTVVLPFACDVDHGALLPLKSFTFCCFSWILTVKNRYTSLFVSSLLSSWPLLCI